MTEPHRRSDGKPLRQYQKRAAHKIFTGTNNDGTALWVDMGLGKTVMVLTAIVEMIRWKVITRPVLVVAPIMVCETVWRQEAKEWSHTQGLTFSLLRGTDHTRRFNLHREAHIYLINPESLDWLHKQLRGDWSMFDMLVIDESSVFKSHRSKRFKLLSRYGDRHAQKDEQGRTMYDAQGKMILMPPHKFKRVVIMSGTPAPTSLMNIWAPIYLLDHGKRIHTNFETFKDHFFFKGQRLTDHVSKYHINPGELELRPEWMPKDGAPVRIHELTADITVELNGEDYGVLPPVLGDATKGAVPNSHLHYVDLPPSVMSMYKQMEKDALVELAHDFVMAANGGAKTMLCWQIANGFLYATDQLGRDYIEHLHALKLDKLTELIDTLDTNTIIPYYFKADYSRIVERLTADGIPFATLGQKNSARIIDDWNAGKIQNLLLHPQSAGHGINLQSGGHTFIWYSLMWSLERYSQTIARLARSGQSHIVANHHIVSRKTVDELMLIAWGERGDTQSRFRSALKKYQQLIGIDIFESVLEDVL